MQPAPTAAGGAERDTRRVAREALERIPEGGRSGASGGRWNERTKR